jgi:serine/threonine protein kinase
MSEKEEIIDNKYKKREQKGSGLTSKVFRVEEINTNKIYAAKIFEKNKYFNNEKQILELLKGKNVPNMINIITGGEISSEKKYLILEYAQKGDLSRFININPLKEIHAKLLFKKIAEIVQNLHNNGVYHRDIKTENILLDEKFNLFISDFGFSTTEKVSSKKVGTYCYAAPEIFRNSAYNCQKVDIFALGVTLFNLVTSTYGFDEAQSSDTFYKLIAIRKYPEYWEKTSTIIKNTISEEFKNLYLKMVAYRVSERPSIKEILEDEWMKEINEKNEKEIKELESEIYKEFCDREEIIKNLTEKNVTKPNNDKYDKNIKGENRNTSEGEKMILKKYYQKRLEKENIWKILM